MSISMYQASIPVFIRMLNNLEVILHKAEERCASSKIDPSVLLNARLYPTMFPLVRQVQIASDFAKGTAARLAGADLPKYEDKEASFAELYERIGKVVAFVTAFKPSQIDGSETRDVQFPAGGQTMQFKGLGYLLDFALPNFYFHLTTAYAILRHNGVELGKKDFIGLR